MVLLMWMYLTQLEVICKIEVRGGIATSHQICHWKYSMIYQTMYIGIQPWPGILGETAEVVSGADSGSSVLVGPTKLVKLGQKSWRMMQLSSDGSPSNPTKAHQ
jgi:hypothetical protein